MSIGREQLQEQRLRLGGQNPLTNFEDSSFAFVDLARSHPGGLAQLVSARETRIGNLVRDGVAQTRAFSAARRIRQRSERIRADFGFETIYLAAGLVETDVSRMPILLWPATLTRRGEDYDLKIGDRPELNPALAQLLRARSSDFSPTELINLASTENDLVALPVLSRVAELMKSPDIGLEKLLVLGNFAPNLLHLQHSGLGEGNALVDSLLGVLDSAVRATGEGLAVPPAADGAAETAKSDSIELTLVDNADSTQQRVLRRALAGHSFAVETLPGCGYLQTVVNLLAQFSNAEKRVLVLAPRKQTLDELAERLSGRGLAGLGIRSNRAWFDAVAAISRFEKSLATDPAPLRQQAAAAQAELVEYFQALNRESLLGVSIFDAMRRLAELAALAEAPTSTAKLRPELLATLRQTGPNLLEAAHTAGLFRFGRKDSAWYGARFESSDEIAAAVRVAKRLSAEELRTVGYQINRYLQDRDLAACNTVEDWSRQLNLLLGIRETLDRLKPEIYDRPLAELIAATAPRNQRGDLSGAQRRRFTKLAKEFVRPGSSVPNLHSALVAAEEQREQWRQLSQTQAPPTVPLGLADVEQKFTALAADLDLLQRHLDPNPDIQLLTRLSFDELSKTIDSLATKTEILDKLLERASLFQELAENGLADLANHLSELGPSLERVQAEFDLSWWQSALESVVSEDSRILDYSAERLAELETSYESAIGELIAMGSSVVSFRQTERWRNAITKNPAQADSLRAMLKTRSLDLQVASRDAPALWRTLGSTVLISPYSAHELEPNEQFDVVLVLDAASVGLAETAAAIARARQLIAFGDHEISVPQNFETTARPLQVVDEIVRESFFDLAAKAFSSEQISRNYRIDGQVLSRYLNEEFYQDRIVFEPSAAEYFGEHGYDLVEVTEDNRANSTIEGATESLESEVEKAVELVLAHARWSPQHSLLVASASATHAERVQARVSAELPKHPQLAEFFDAHGREQFAVATLANLTHRVADRVIFSIGFGRTAEGKVSSALGDLSDSHAPRRLANLIVSARSRLTVVSCFDAQSVSGNSANDSMLRALLAPKHLDQVRNGEPDALLTDLSLRLQKLGARVQLNFAGRIGLAASFGKQAAVVDPDWGLVGDTWDEKLRLRPGLLRAMGWQYRRVHVLELFSNPQQVANRIALQLGIELERKPEPLFEGVAREDTAAAWGDPDDSNDQRLREDKPPHWG